MFTGIVQETGAFEAIESDAKSTRFVVRAKATANGLKTGGSVAVNGCCLTAVEVGSRKKTGQRIVFDLLRETWTRTNLQFLKPGSLVNLERSLRVGDRLDGHFVTGHIDGIGKIRCWEQVKNDYLMEVAAPGDIMACMVPKGSIALDGISLTVAEIHKDRFRVWIIPHTYEVTNLREKKVGDSVNLEADLIGKYVVRLIQKSVQMLEF